MKKIIVFAAATMLAISFTACKKDSATTTPATVVLTASKSAGIKQGEPVIFNAVATLGTDTVKWVVTPLAYAQVNVSGAMASILFKQKGQYVITAIVGANRASNTVNVTDSIYKSPVPDSTNTNYSTVALTGDQLTLTPAVSDSGNYVSISTLTKNAYSCLNNSLKSKVTSSANAHSISYTGVSIPNGTACKAGKIKAASFAYLYSPVNGKYNFSVQVNGVTYNGSYTKTGNSYTFTWPYTSGVIISPLTVTK